MIIEIISLKDADSQQLFKKNILFIMPKNCYGKVLQNAKKKLYSNDTSVTLAHYLSLSSYELSNSIYFSPNNVFL
jgi:hypothetical protein